MSNLGFQLAMAREGVAVVETAVGDRYVLEAMKAGGFSLGGEQSGHVIMLDHATTGDGLAHRAAPAGPGGRDRQAAGRAGRGDGPAAAGAGQRHGRRPAPASATARRCRRRSRAAEAELGATGRVLLRPSGTEPLVRVMVEAADEAQADAVAERLAEVVKAELTLG